MSLTLEVEDEVWVSLLIFFTILMELVTDVKFCSFIRDIRYFLIIFDNKKRLQDLWSVP